MTRKKIPAMIDNLPFLIDTRLEMSSETVDALKKPELCDLQGQVTSTLRSDCHFLACAFYRKDGDIAKFRHYMVRRVDLTQQLYDRRAAGEPIALSFLSLLAVEDIFNALSIGEWRKAEKLASSMGIFGDADKEMVHPFDYVFGQAIKYFVLNDREQVERWLPKVIQKGQKGHLNDHLGYIDAIQAVLDHDTAAIQPAFERIIAGHKRLSKGSGRFALSGNEILCVWGIGLANLCRHRGLHVDGIPPLIPDDLLI